MLNHMRVNVGVKRREGAHSSRVLFYSFPSLSRLTSIMWLEWLDSAHAGFALESHRYCEGPLKERR
jgi:hypothetical protein